MDISACTACQLYFSCKTSGGHTFGAAPLEFVSTKILYKWYILCRQQSKKGVPPCSSLTDDPVSKKQMNGISRQDTARLHWKWEYGRFWMQKIRPFTYRVEEMPVTFKKHVFKDNKVKIVVSSSLFGSFHPFPATFCYIWTGTRTLPVHGYIETDKSYLEWVFGRMLLKFVYEFERQFFWQVQGRSRH